MAKNGYEEDIGNIAADFKTSVAGIIPAMRRGDRPPFTRRLTPSDYADPYLSEKAAQYLERQGLPEQAALVRHHAAGLQTPGSQGSLQPDGAGEFYLRPPTV